MAGAADRRFGQILSAVTHAGPAETDGALTIVLNKVSAASGAGTLKIGDVSAPLMVPERPELVPVNFGLVNGEAVETARHLRWILQKDLNGQDIYLIGPPGPLRRRLAMLYSELRGREVEYLCLSRDTTESDLKQRREIVVGGSTSYTDQAPVRAAINGRILILDGLERAERNVLPTLNNLLENREMTLEDGRLLLAAERYDELLEQYTAEELDVRRLVRVSPYFRVIALGLPVPIFPGRSLDPPLRSRFQARSVPAAEADSLAREVLDYEWSHDLSDEMLRKLISMTETLRILERQSGGVAANLPHLSDPVKQQQQRAPTIHRHAFPARGTVLIPNCAHARVCAQGAMRVARKLAMFPDMAPAAAMNQAYPHRIIAKVDTGMGDDDSNGRDVRFSVALA
jgi:MoxR-like ATPase